MTYSTPSVWMGRRDEMMPTNKTSDGIYTCKRNNDPCVEEVLTRLIFYLKYHHHRHNKFVIINNNKHTKRGKQNKVYDPEPNMKTLKIFLLAKKKLNLC